MSFGTKTTERYKVTHDDLFLHLNHPHINFHPNIWRIIFGYFVIVSNQYNLKI